MASTLDAFLDMFGDEKGEENMMAWTVPIELKTPETVPVTVPEMNKKPKRINELILSEKSKRTDIAMPDFKEKKLKTVQKERKQKEHIKPSENPEIVTIQKEKINEVPETLKKKDIFTPELEYKKPKTVQKEKKLRNNEGRKRKQNKLTKLEPKIKKPGPKESRKPSQIEEEENMVFKYCLPQIPSEKVKLDKPPCILFPQITHTAYMCENCWRKTKNIPAITTGDSIKITISLCNDCVGLNTQMVALYTHTMCAK